MFLKCLMIYNFEELIWVQIFPSNRADFMIKVNLIKVYFTINIYHKFWLLLCGTFHCGATFKRLEMGGSQPYSDLLNPEGWLGTRKKSEHTILGRSAPECWVFGGEMVITSSVIVSTAAIHFCMIRVPQRQSRSFSALVTNGYFSQFYHVLSKN